MRAWRTPGILGGLVAALLLVSLALGESGARVLLVSARSDDPIVARMTQELRVLGLEVAYAQSSALGPAPRLAELAHERSAAAAARIEGDPPVVVLWVNPARAPAGDDSAGAEIRLDEAVTGSRDPALLALRAVEMLRGRLIPVPSLAPPDAGTTPESGASPVDQGRAIAPSAKPLERAPSPPSAQAQALHGVSGSLGPGMLASPGGVPVALDSRARRALSSGTTRRARAARPPADHRAERGLERWKRGAPRVRGRRRARRLVHERLLAGVRLGEPRPRRDAPRVPRRRDPAASFLGGQRVDGPRLTAGSVEAMSSRLPSPSASICSSPWPDRSRSCAWRARRSPTSASPWSCSRRASRCGRERAENPARPRALFALLLVTSFACGQVALDGSLPPASGPAGLADAGAPCPLGESRCNGACTSLAEDPSSCGACGQACASGQVCSAGVCASSCGAGLLACSSSCVDPGSDPAHCGGCASACAPTASCAGGACVCAPGLIACGPACVDLASDPSSCGECGHVCPAAQVCSQGACAAGCAPSETSCGGACVDLQSDPAACGECATKCPGGAACVKGTCACAGGLGACAGACVDLGSSPANCGGCGAACAAPSVCSAGTCEASCGAGATLCAGACVDVTSNSANCGACGVACTGGSFCVGGSCTCPAGTAICGGFCVDTSSSATNCGACGVACPPGLVCAAGQCLPKCPSGSTRCGGGCVATCCDNLDCGACGVACVGGTTCSGAVCACGPGQTLCGSVLQGHAVEQPRLRRMRQRLHRRRDLRRRRLRLRPRAEELRIDLRRPEQEQPALRRLRQRLHREREVRRRGLRVCRPSDLLRREMRGPRLEHPELRCMREMPAGNAMRERRLRVRLARR